jgi:hypothetical protein
MFLTIPQHLLALLLVLENTVPTTLFRLVEAKQGNRAMSGGTVDHLYQGCSRVAGSKLQRTMHIRVFHFDTLLIA